MGQDRDLCMLTTADNPVEAGALRAYLEDNGVFVYVQGEHHSSMLGQFGSFAIALNVMVPRDQLELAHELVVAFRDGEAVPELFDDDGEGELHDQDGEDEDGDAADGEDDEGDAADDDSRSLRLAYDLREVTVYGFLGFGLGHFKASAPGRGLILAAVFPAALLGVASFGMASLALIPIAMTTDVLGARARVRELYAIRGGAARLPSARLPSARLLRRRGRR